MTNPPPAAPDNTAVRTALWRALHLEVDAAPPVFEVDRPGPQAWKRQRRFSTSGEMLALARDAGFRRVQHVSAAQLAQRHFQRRADGLRPPENAEELLVATT